MDDSKTTTPNDSVSDSVIEPNDSGPSGIGSGSGSGSGSSGMMDLH